jgi:hypothetical protein
MTTVQQVVTDAFLRINSFEPGETLSPNDQTQGLNALNDLLDSWSTDHLSVVGSQEVIFNWPTGQQLDNGIAKYTYGNPLCTDIGEQGFSGTLSSGSPTISGVTNMPADMSIGATLYDSANVIPSGTTVLSFTSNTVTMSANATATPSSGTDTITYTIPGDIPFQRPLRITNGFTRINNLDFYMEVTMSRDRFVEILYKAQPGPWPVCAWYNPQFPYGILNVYMVPAMQAEAHLFVDTIFTNLKWTDTVQLPQGYVRALKWCLAEEICAQYGFPITDAIKKKAAESYNMIKALNAQPAVVSKYDRELVRGNRPDGGWIIHGGYR